MIAAGATALSIASSMMKHRSYGVQSRATIRMRLSLGRANYCRPPQHCYRDETKCFRRPKLRNNPSEVELWEYSTIVDPPHTFAEVNSNDVFVNKRGKGASGELGRVWDALEILNMACSYQLR